jgi:hypothetical protein
MSAADRSRLLPLLGRAIGLAVPEQAATRPRRRFRRPVQDDDARAVADRARAVGRPALHDRSGSPGVPGRLAELRSGRDVDRFWPLMSEPCPVRTSAAYVDRLSSRLVLLHQRYEQAMDELALPRTVPAGQTSSEVLSVTS